MNYLTTDLFQEQSQLPPGLTYTPNYITPDQQKELITTIDNQPWLTDLKRRVQHYGYKYDYKARNIASDSYLGEIPTWLKPYCQKLLEDGFFKELPDQVIINEYQVGQGISAHIDRATCFTDTICSISILSPCEMIFSKDKEKINLTLQPLSLAVMQKDSRYLWSHEIPARKSNIKERRLSVTFRKVVL